MTFDPLLCVLRARGMGGEVSTSLVGLAGAGAGQLWALFIGDIFFRVWCFAKEEEREKERARASVRASEREERHAPDRHTPYMAPHI